MRLNQRTERSVKIAGREKLSKVARPAGVLLPVTVLSYFLWLAGTGIRAGSSHDDLMNMWRAWRDPWPRLLLENICFLAFPTANRPFGQLFYKTFFDLFDLNPLPFRICIFTVLIANLYLAYLLARRLTGSAAAGYLASLLHGFHVGFMPLYCDTGTCYDVFCFFFYVAALCYYTGARQGGRRLGRRQQIVLLALYICALDSKEVAVTLPVMIVAYEVIYQMPRWQGFSVFAAWARKDLVVASWGLFFAVLFVVFKVNGSGGLGRTEGYSPTIRLSTYLKNLHLIVDQVFLIRGAAVLNEQVLIVLLVIMLGAGMWVKSPPIRFAVVFFLLGIGPVGFFAVPRGMYAAYIPLLGLALIAASSIVNIGVWALRHIDPVWWVKVSSPGGHLNVVVCPLRRFCHPASAILRGQRDPSGRLERRTV
ncbi:MAG: hypothetical protein U0Q18_16035 [Bryobacteraceae bacterium]